MAVEETMRKNMPKPGILFYGDCRVGTYELSLEGLQFKNGAGDRIYPDPTIVTSVKERIMRIFMDGRNEEHEKFDRMSASYELLNKLLN